MVSPLLIAFLAGVATLCITFGFLRPHEGLVSRAARNSLRESVDIKLKRAGLVTASPSAVILAVILTMAVVFFVFLFAFGQVVIAAIFSLAVPMLLSLSLDRRARRYQDQLTSRLVPFLRKITAQVRTGQNPTRAFAVAAAEDPLLAWVLRAQLANLQMQQPFQNVLRDTLEVMPLRPWVQFVRSMESFSRSGGELAEILEANVSRIQSQVVLRQRLMGDVATYRGQQIIILLFAVLIPATLVAMAPALFGSLFTTSGGLTAIALSLGLDGLALWITRNAIKDVEGKMEA